MSYTTSFALITKSAPQDDGTLLVYGKATGSDLDLDQQRMEPNWLRKAMKTFMAIGNIREQHNAKRAIGKALEHEEKPDGHYIKVHVVDPVAVLKTKTGVFTGFSIGIARPVIEKSTDAPNGLVSGGSITEISLVDRPALPTATMSICKAFDSVEELLSGLDGKMADLVASVASPVIADLLAQGDAYAGPVRKKDGSWGFAVPAKSSGPVLVAPDQVSEGAVKAAELRAKAAATTDRDLRAGYLQMAMAKDLDEASTAPGCGCDPDSCACGGECDPGSCDCPGCAANIAEKLAYSTTDPVLRAGYLARRAAA